ncbi:hypothetical protein OAP56_01055 [Rickettsiaceae bacterium]|nr:hypothetical protein [Rickettsiaceae bacterium]
MGDESSKDSEVDTTRKGIKSTPRQQASYRTNESTRNIKVNLVILPLVQKKTILVNAVQKNKRCQRILQFNDQLKAI